MISERKKEREKERKKDRHLRQCVHVQSLLYVQLLYMYVYVQCMYMMLSEM